MEINEATCLCRFGGCEVLRDGAHAESNYWSVTSTAECLHAKVLCARICWHLHRSAEAHVSASAHLKTRVLPAGRPLHVSLTSRWLWECKSSSSPIRRLHVITQKTHSSSETVGPPLCFCLSDCGLAFCLTPTFIHTHTQKCTFSLHYATSTPLRPPTHTPVGVVR